MQREVCGLGCFLAANSVALDETGDFPTRILIRHHLSAIMTGTFLNNQFTSALSFVNIGCEVDRFSELRNENQCSHDTFISLKSVFYHKYFVSFLANELGYI